jgi:hypothetical protein
MIVIKHSHDILHCSIPESNQQHLAFLPCKVRTSFVLLQVAYKKIEERKRDEKEETLEYSYD